MEAETVKTETDVGVPSEGDTISIEPYKVYIPSAFSVGKYEPELNSDAVKIERDVDAGGEEDCTDMKTDEVYRPSVLSIKTEYENCADVLETAPGFCTEMCLTASDIKVEADSDVPEEEDPLAGTTPATKAEQENVVSEPQLLHVEVHPYSCSVCSKSYTNPNSLRKHKRVHSQAQAFPCDVCNKPFTYQNDLKKHQRIHTDCVNPLLYALTASKIWEHLPTPNCISTIMWTKYFLREVAFGVIRTVTCSSLQSVLMLHCTLVRRKLDYASVVWNFNTSSDVSKLERIQQKFLSLCHRHIFGHLQCSYVNVLNYLRCHTLSVWRYHIDMLFLLNVYSGPKFCSTILETVGLHVLNQNLRGFGLLHVHFKCCNSCSTKCASTANAIRRDSGLFTGKFVLINSLLDVDIFTN